MNKSSADLQPFWLHLRDNFRLKLGCDYAYTFKYGLLRIMCDAVYKERIVEEANKFGIEIAQIFTYD